MLNEGMIRTDERASIKSVMVEQLRKLDETSPDGLERVVFKALTGHDREEIDWDFEDNQAGYYTWIKAFDGLITELVEDGYARVEERDGKRFLRAAPADPTSNWSPGTHPSQG
jgi:hypothetical protein